MNSRNSDAHPAAPRTRSDRCIGDALVSVAFRFTFGALACLSMHTSAAQALPESGSANADKPCQRPMRHVASPDWRDQIIYFAMTDRFDDGDPSNNSQGHGEFRPGDGVAYNGGDLRGLTRRLAYIQGLGATALWLTPPVANQWTSPEGPVTGYHGYWASHFKEVDPHLGTLKDYQTLAEDLHCRGMYLVQDIVVNHTGDYFSYGKDWSPQDPGRDYRGHTATAPSQRPAQPPFDLNDPRREQDRRAGIYHWTPDVSDYRIQRQEHTYQMGGLDDLNTENPRVRDALRESYAYWIREVGVDAFRVDTAFYVPQSYFADFLFSPSKTQPGIANVAKSTGRDSFLVFGEGFGIDKRGEQFHSRKIESYMRGSNGNNGLPGMLNFPLYGALQSVIARGAPPSELGERIASMVKLHPRLHWMPSFVDNHDLDRFLAGASEPALKQALLAIMTLPGIPVIYYGTEQGFKLPRAAMFAKGYGSGDRDHFDTSSPLYRYVQSVTALRRSNQTLSRGIPRVLTANDATAGAVVWETTLGKDRLITALNTSDQPTYVTFDVASSAGLASKSTRRALTTGTNSTTGPAMLRGVFSIDGNPTTLKTLADGRVSVTLPARAGVVWRVDPPLANVQQTPPRAASASNTTAPLAITQIQTAQGKTTIHGRALPGELLRVVVDGAIENAAAVEAGEDGRWQVPLDTSHWIDGRQQHEAVALGLPDKNSAAPTTDTTRISAARKFSVAPSWTTAVDYTDPKGDDTGPKGAYHYPQDVTWGVNRQMDIRRVTAKRAGGSLEIDIALNKITRTWQPANGFDHVALTLYLGLPDRTDGARVMPLQNAELPDNMRWHYRLRVNGWTNALFTHDNASATNEGTPVSPGARLKVDPTKNIVTLTLPANALGKAASLKGARLYVTTWDYDGGYRELTTAGGRYTIGGGDGARDPLVMDDTPVLTLK